MTELEEIARDAILQYYPGADLYGIIVKALERVQKESLAARIELPEILNQYCQTHRSQGVDGPWTDHENLVFGTYNKIKDASNTDLYPPGLWFANGWMQCLSYIRNIGYRAAEKKARGE